MPESQRGGSETLPRRTDFSLCAGDLVGMTCPCGAHFHVPSYVWFRFYMHSCPECRTSQKMHDLRPSNCDRWKAVTSS